MQWLMRICDPQTTDCNSLARFLYSYGLDLDLDINAATPLSIQMLFEPGCMQAYIDRSMHEKNRHGVCQLLFSWHIPCTLSRLEMVTRRFRISSAWELCWAFSLISFSCFATIPITSSRIDWPRFWWRCFFLRGDAGPNAVTYRSWNFSTSIIAQRFKSVNKCIRCRCKLTYPGTSSSGQVSLIASTSPEIASTIRWASNMASLLGSLVT